MTELFFLAQYIMDWSKDYPKIKISKSDFEKLCAFAYKGISLQGQAHKLRDSDPEEAIRLMEQSAIHENNTLILMDSLERGQ